MDIQALQKFGWRSFFQQQISLDEWGLYILARVVIQHRNQLHLDTADGEIILPQQHNMPTVAVGDWLMLDEQHNVHRRLDRFSQFSRRAAGDKVAEQLIAANIDSVFIVTSLNQDFNLNRIERYLALAHESEVQPIIVLTKADLCQNDVINTALQAAQSLDALLPVIALNSSDAQACEQLQAYCYEGQTVAILGSSGVGKSTLTNTLLCLAADDTNAQITDGIREQDSKGRHTTTSRALKIMPSGGLLLDTPGMRELQLFDSEQGIATTFSDITALAEHCKFGDCSHQNEPGCKVQAALAQGKIDERRLNNYRKLLREQMLNNASLAEKRAREKSFSKSIHTIQSGARKIKEGR